MSEVIDKVQEELDLQVDKYEAKRKKWKIAKWMCGSLLAIVMLAVYIYLAFFNTEFELVEYTRDDVHEYGIRIAHSTASVVVIPAEYDGHTITFIDSENAENDNLKALIIEEGIQRIGYYPDDSAEEIYVGYWGIDGAFSGSPLWYVKLPSTMKSIESWAFYQCVYLSWIDFPDTFEKCVIGGWSFAHTRIRTLELPAGVEGMAESAFAGCTRLKKVELPDTLADVGPYAFKSCTALREVKLSSNMSYLSFEMFYGCKKLKKMEIPENIRYIARNALYETKISAEMRPDHVFYNGSGSVEYGLDMEKENKYLMEVAGVPEEPLLSTHDSNKIWIEGQYYEFPMSWEQFYSMDEWVEKEPHDEDAEEDYVRVYYKDSGRSLSVKYHKNMIMGINVYAYDNPCLVVLPGGTVPGYSLPYRINMQNEESELTLEIAEYPYGARYYYLGQDRKYVVKTGDWAFDGTIDEVEIYTEIQE